MTLSLAELPIARLLVNSFFFFFFFFLVIDIRTSERKKKRRRGEGRKEKRKKLQLFIDYSFNNKLGNYHFNRC